MGTIGARFKMGCLGCLGLVALLLLVVLVVLVVAVTASLTARPAQVEDRSLVPDVGNSDFGGQVILTIQEAELHIQAAEPGEALRINGRYDVNAFALDGEVVPDVSSDSAWTYSVTFDRAERAGAFSGLVSVVRGSTARIDVALPSDMPLDLTLKMNEGGAVVRLGGLWLRNARIEVASGAMDLSVDDPLHEPMDSLSISTAKGGALLNRLGNASPRRLDVSYRMGQIDMDLGGRWLADADITIDGGTGGGVVHLPADVNLIGLDRHGIEAAAVPEPQLPTLRFSVSTGVGWLEFADWAIRGGSGG